MPDHAEHCFTSADEGRTGFEYTITINGQDVTRKCWKAVAGPEGYVCVWNEWPNGDESSWHVCGRCEIGICSYTSSGDVRIVGRWAKASA